METLGPEPWLPLADGQTIHSLATPAPEGSPLVAIWPPHSSVLSSVMYRDHPSSFQEVSPGWGTQGWKDLGSKLKGRILFNGKPVSSLKLSVPAQTAG